MGKYDPLRAYLATKAEANLTMTFTEIEVLVGPLPKTARTRPTWWTNDHKIQAQAWQAAGWHVRSVDQSVGQANFQRVNVTEKQGDKPEEIGSASTNTPSSPAPVSSPDAQPPSAHQKASRNWPTLLIAVAGALATAVITVIPISAIPRWAAFLIALDVSLATTALTSAITKPKARLFSLVASNVLLILLIGGVAIYNLVPTDSTVNVVPSSDVTLSTQAGSAPDSSDPYGTLLPAGDGETATCYTTIRGKVWLYFHFSNNSYGWAPFSDFSYQVGFPRHLPANCS